MPRDLHYRLCAQVLGFVLPVIIKQKGKQLQAKAMGQQGSRAEP